MATISQNVSGQRLVTVALSANLSDLSLVNAQDGQQIVLGFEQAAASNFSVASSTIVGLRQPPPGNSFQFFTYNATRGMWTPSAQATSLKIFASDYGVTANTQCAVAASWTSASNVVTLGSTDGTFAPGDVGKLIFGVSACNAQNGQQSGTTQIKGKINAVLTSKTCTVSANATATSTAPNSRGFTGWLLWGTDDTASLQAAWAATKLAAGQTLSMPLGMLMITAQPFYSVTGSIFNNSIEGGGPSSSGTILVPHPSFNYAGAQNALIYYDIANNTNPLWTAGDTADQNCAVYAALRNFTVWGAGQDGTTVSNTLPIFFAENVLCSNVWGVGWNYNTGSTKNTAPCWQVNGAVLYSCGAWSAGNYGVECTGDAQLSASTTHFYGGLYGLTNGHSVVITAGRVQSHSTKWGTGGISTDAQSVRITGGDWASFGDQFSGVLMSGGLAHVYGSSETFASGTAVWSISGGEMFAAGCMMGGLTMTAGAFTDLGGNYTSTGTPWTNGTLTISGGVLAGAASVTGVAASAGAFTLAGWGTSPTISAVAGNTRRIQITVTAAATPAANPSIALAYPTPFAIAPIATIAQTGGTNFTDVTAPVQSVAATPAGVTFQFAGTPIAGHAYTFVIDSDTP